MPFRFGLETVLKHRRRLEDVAQREYAEAQAAVDACLAELESLYRRSDEVRIEIAAQETSGSPGSLELVREMEHFLGGQKIRIERLRMKARELLMVAETKHEALILASQERKVLAKLKDRRFNEYRERLNRMEAKELDDLTMVRVARRARGMNT